MKYQKSSTLGLIIISLLAGASAFAGEYIVSQKDKTFVFLGKKVEKFTIKTGDRVHFKNEDPFFHNIFSLSDQKTFDLGSFPKDLSKSVTFDKAGTVKVECAIHPEMFMEITIE
jgi:plastocyanin